MQDLLFVLYDLLISIAATDATLLIVGPPACFFLRTSVHFAFVKPVGKPNIYSPGIPSVLKGRVDRSIFRYTSETLCAQDITNIQSQGTVTF